MGMVKVVLGVVLLAIVAVGGYALYERHGGVSNSLRPTCPTT